MNVNKEGTNRRSTDGDRRDRKFAVSANRGKASHRIRYVETGGSGVDIDECTFCEAMPDLSDARQKDTEEE
ncbi:MAG: hypothetical protein L0J77_13540 [Marinobacter sp.]|nr:hypothetical protein [Marinobacter sp.]